MVVQAQALAMAVAGWQATAELLSPRRTFSPRHAHKTRATTTCSASGHFSSPKTGTVGEDRFKNAAVPGTYWSRSGGLGAEVLVEFHRGSDNVMATARSGENLLKLAERLGVMLPNPDFCFQGSCCHCEMEVVGGAEEVGFGADRSGTELIRSCICPVPEGRQSIRVNLINDEAEWGHGVV